MNRSVPSFRSVPMNRLLATTIVTLPLVWELIPTRSIAFWAVMACVDLHSNSA
jgi:hypothetical protein